MTLVKNQFENNLTELQPTENRLQSLIQQNQQYKNQLDAKNLEIETCYQELYESSRYNSHLSKEVLNTATQIRLYEQRIANLENQISSLINSRSWKLTSPLRKVLSVLKIFGIKNG